MFRDGHFRPKYTLTIVFNDGGLGDNIARMTAIKYIKDTNKNFHINLIVPDYFKELANNLVPDLEIHTFSEGPSHWMRKAPALQTRNAAHDALKSHLVDHAFHVLVNRQVDIEDKNYCKLNTKAIDITKFNLPEKYVIVTTGFTAPVREMLPQTINDVVTFVKSKGYEVVFLGSKEAATGMQHNIQGNFKEEIDFTAGIDLINKTSILEAGKIISQAKTIVGLDNGLLHLAGTTDIPIVMAFTTVDPVHRLPYRNNQLGYNCQVVVPEPSLKCRFCQSNWDFVYNHDFKYCFYKDYKCTKMLTANKYIEKLNLLLN
jgi:ADP-heptose:LPS heptosyltransferase